MFEENVEIVVLFRMLETQWLVQPVGMFGNVRYMGLNYPSVESVMRIRKMKRQAELLDGIHVMELAALEVLNGTKASVAKRLEQNVEGGQGDARQDGRVGGEQENGAA